MSTLPGIEERFAPYRAVMVEFAAEMQTRIALIRHLSAEFTIAQRPPQAQWGHKLFTILDNLLDPHELRIPPYEGFVDAEELRTRVPHFQVSEVHRPARREGDIKTNTLEALAISALHFNGGKTARMMLKPGGDGTACEIVDGMDVRNFGSPEHLASYLRDVWFDNVAGHYAHVAPVAKKEPHTDPNIDADFAPYVAVAEEFFARMQDRIAMIEQISPDLNPDQRSLVDLAVDFLKEAVGETETAPIQDGPRMHINTRRNPMSTLISLAPGFDPRYPHNREPIIGSASIIKDTVTGVISLHERRADAYGDDPTTRLTDLKSPQDLAVALEQWFAMTGGYYAPVVRPRPSMGV